MPNKMIMQVRLILTVLHLYHFHTEHIKIFDKLFSHAGECVN